MSHRALSAALLFAALSCLTSPARAQTVTVDGTEQHQRILGFGGNMESHEAYEEDSEFWGLLFDEG